jgi:diguanylate cyclase (GGDEF)-like protein
MQKVAMLYDASQAVFSALETETVLRQILAVTRDFFQLKNVAIFLLHEEMEELHLRSQVGWEAGLELTIKVGAGLVGAAALEKQPVNVPDVGRDPRYIGKSPSTRSELAIPLIIRDQVLGVLDCQSEQPGYFNDEMTDLLTLFAAQASMALQNAQLHQRERKRTQQLRAINDVAQQMTGVLDRAEFLAKVCPLIQQAFQISQVSVLLKEEDEIVIRATSGTLSPVYPEGYRVPAEGGFWGDCLARGRSLVQSDFKNNPGTFLCRDSAASICIPLVSFGQNLGILVLESDQSGAFRSEDMQALESVADICATAIQNVNYVEQVKQLAYLDGLTGIFNRRFFELRLAEEMDRARRFTTGMAVVMIDIDRFKMLNDEFGHLLGDEALRQISSLFHQNVRKIDVVCRYGGEEFAILLSQTEPQYALAVAEKLRRVVQEWQFPGVPRRVTISGGVATFPGHGITRDELIDAADGALYRAKQEGRNRVLMAAERQAGTARGAGI